MTDIYSPAPELQQNSFETKFARSFQGPATLDLLVNTSCQMSCQFCFAPQEQIPEMPSANWLSLIFLSHLMHTESLIFTGGEPLLLEFLPDLLKYAKYLGQRTTLSTNAMLFLYRYREVMPFVDEIGIPIDGPTPEQNAIMREPNGEEQFNAAIEAIKVICREYPGVELTIRTVVSALNFDLVLQIPEALRRLEIYMQKVRWKLYQFNPIGNQFDGSLMEKLCISTDDFLSLWASLRETGLWFDCFPATVQEGTYAIVYPNGDLVTAIPDTERPNPYDFPLFQYKKFGNLCTEFIKAMKEWQKWKSETNNI